MYKLFHLNLEKNTFYVSIKDICMLKAYIDSDKLLMPPDWIYRHAIYQGSLVSQHGLINLNKIKSDPRTTTALNAIP